MNKYLLTLFNCSESCDKLYQCVLTIEEDLDNEIGSLNTDRDIMMFNYKLSVKYQCQLQKALNEKYLDIRIIFWNKINDNT